MIGFGTLLVWNRDDATGNDWYRATDDTIIQITALAGERFSVMRFVVGGTILYDAQTEFPSRDEARTVAETYAISAHLTKPIVCKFCGHRYYRPCGTLGVAAECGNYQWMNSRGDIGRIDPDTQEPLTPHGELLYEPPAPAAAAPPAAVPALTLPVPPPAPVETPEAALARMLAALK